MLLKKDILVNIDHMLFKQKDTSKICIVFKNNNN